MQRELAQFLLLFSVLAWFMGLHRTAGMLGVASVLLLACDLLTLPAPKKPALSRRAICSALLLRKRSL